jgi:uncharacterized membrane protein
MSQIIVWPFEGPRFKVVGWLNLCSAIARLFPSFTGKVEFWLLLS